MPPMWTTSMDRRPAVTTRWTLAGSKSRLVFGRMSTVCCSCRHLVDAWYSKSLYVCIGMLCLSYTRFFYEENDVIVLRKQFSNSPLHAYVVSTYSGNAISMVNDYGTFMPVSPRRNSN